MSDGPSRREPQPLEEAALRPTTYGVERPASGFDTILTLNRDRWRIDPHAALRLMEMLVQQLCARLPSVHDLESIEDLKARAEHAEAQNTDWLARENELVAKAGLSPADYTFEEAYERLEERLQTALRAREELQGEIDGLKTVVADERERKEKNRQRVTELEAQLQTTIRERAVLHQALAAVRQQLEQANTQLENLVKLEAAYRENEQTMLRRLSRILTGGNASQWEQITEAAEQQLADLLALRQQLGQADAKQNVRWCIFDSIEGVAYCGGHLQPMEHQDDGWLCRIGRVKFEFGCQFGQASKSSPTPGAARLPAPHGCPPEKDRLDAALRLLEAIQTQHVYLHDGHGNALTRDEFVSVVTNALSTVLPDSPAAASPQGNLAAPPASSRPPERD